MTEKCVKENVGSTDNENMTEKCVKENVGSTDNENMTEKCVKENVGSTDNERSDNESKRLASRLIQKPTHHHQIEPYRRKAADTERHALSMIREWVQHLIPAPTQDSVRRNWKYPYGISTPLVYK
ncbi:hypothetical protein Ddc_17241 [Ditylenchus destructor]|nr:hypothetical protein Ddc_17241 [Ditylenchus destructor]